MSGCGRKHRAKHLVRQYLDDDAWDGPEKIGDILAVCIAAPSAKHVHVVVVDPPSDAVKEAEKKLESIEVTPQEGTKAEEVAEASASALPPRTVADLPGKFKKVLWLGCGDLIVLRLGSVHYKPSPQQLKYFYSTPIGMSWQPLVTKAESVARQYFTQVQSSTPSPQGQTNSKNLSEGKFVVRKIEGGNDNVTVKPATVDSATEAAANNLDGGYSDEDDLNAFVNPNRQSIKHRREAFFPGEDEEGEEEEDEEGEEGDECD